MELAEIIWILEKEPIGIALLTTNILRQMINHTKNVAEKESLTLWAEKFEDKAEGVLEECFIENPQNTRENLIRERYYFGNSTCLDLAAQGNSMRFIAHRSCIDLYDFIWRYCLDESVKPIHFMLYLIVGVTFPFALPFLVQYKIGFYSEHNDKGNINKPNTINIPNSNETNTNSNEFHKFEFGIYVSKIFDFYSTTSVKFVYGVIFYIFFILYFTFLNLTGLHVKLLQSGNSWVFGVLVVWSLSFSLEDFRQGIESGLSLDSYFNNIWKKMSLTGHFFFLIGSFCIVLTLFDPVAKWLMFSLLDIKPMFSISSDLIKVSKFAYSFSMFFFTMGILRYFVINIEMGPIIIMIRNMLINDLRPFMIIWIVVIIAYGVLLWVISFEVNTNMSMSDLSIVIYGLLRFSYFQSFGDLNIPILHGEFSLPRCEVLKQNCPDPWGLWLAPILTAVFMVISVVLMLNLLIAIFSNTYSAIESSATEYWTLEKYNFLTECAKQPPIVPPFIIFWHAYYAMSKLCGYSCEIRNPFKKAYHNSKLKENQLIQWEHLRAIDYMRLFDDNNVKGRNKRTVVMGKGNVSGVTISKIKKELEFVRNDIIEYVKEKIKIVESRLERLDVIDENVVTIIETLKNIQISNINVTLQSGNELPTQVIEQLPENIDSIEFAKLSPITRLSLDNKINTDNSTKLWSCKLRNHTLLRLVPLININQILKMDSIISNMIDSISNSSSTCQYGIPVNPYKSLHQVGKVYLPVWGRNNCLHIIITRWKRDEKDNIVKSYGKPILQIIGIGEKNIVEIPFIFILHNAACLVDSCTTDLWITIIKDYLYLRTNENFQLNIIEEVYRGYINDRRNTDNSWMETVAFNIQQAYSMNISPLILKSFEHHESENASWVDVIEANWTNPSNVELLKELTKQLDAAF